MPCPIPLIGWSSGGLSCGSIIEEGREFRGVTCGESFGVEDVLPFLAFRELDRGVILELRKDLTGVVASLVLLFVLAPGLKGTRFWSDPTGGEDSTTGDIVYGSIDGLARHMGEFKAAEGRALVTGVGF